MLPAKHPIGRGITTQKAARALRPDLLRMLWHWREVRLPGDKVHHLKRLLNRMHVASLQIAVLERSRLPVTGIFLSFVVDRVSEDPPKCIGKLAKTDSGLHVIMCSNLNIGISLRNEPIFLLLQIP